MTLLKYNQIIIELQQLLAEEQHYHQASVKRISEINAKVGALTDHYNSCVQTSYQNMTSKPTVANGHIICRNEFQNINDDDFDIILDITKNSLRYRKDPAKRSPLKNADLKGIGPRRIEILMYLIEHPTRYISIENVSQLPQQTDIVEPNALSKTISLLRKALDQNGSKGPYIITEPSLGSIYHIYKIDPQWHYLVIKNILKITEKSVPGELENHVNGLNSIRNEKFSRTKS